MHALIAGVSSCVCVPCCVQEMLFLLSYSLSLAPTDFLPPLVGRPPSPGKSMEHTQPLAMGVCVNCLLLQEEAPLMRAELYGYSSASLGVISMLCPVGRVIVGVLP